MNEHNLVLRFPVSDRPEQSFLLEVIPTEGSKNALNLKLVGTEGIKPYVVKLRHQRIQEWKASVGHCTDDEWEQILIATLIEPSSPHGKDIEVKVELVEGKKPTANLIIRKNLSGITQRLGSIELKENGNEFVDPFQWCVNAIGDLAKVDNDLAAATAKAAELEKTTNELKAQLEDLLKAKDDDERQLLEKFRDLLNEKKLKIRQQQRLLASAEVDPEKLQNVGASQNTLRKAKASRDSKRKAAEEEPDDVSDDDSDKMEVDEPVKVKDESDQDVEDHDDLEDRQTTDDELGEATASETDDTDEEAQPATRTKAKHPIKAASTGRAGKTPASRSTRSTRTRSETPPSDAQDEDEDEDVAPPPSRALPVQARKQSTLQAQATNNDDTETDDEL
ncbi:hypothetical protein PFICI_09387 [Pestalotiopsis fici W106-1]|uniref:Uncharacterized protein n=1 Tax=Pestalotiopsis fici (strain W106-1 / CGMCC3.15140) TaxID=1229662 RepID=W3X0H9_PESFW|nr:uncharacterized protein PFICI_09387 [Pestalotiopsis fici W106-1]ETS79534.1 hypothetical protein PFICI_09387 [Pestalotiopsis fici W106-1]